MAQQALWEHHTQESEMRRLAAKSGCKDGVPARRKKGSVGSRGLGAYINLSLGRHPRLDLAEV